MLSKNCVFCKKKFVRKQFCPKRQWLKSRFCSNRCSGFYRKGKSLKHDKQFQKGNIPWNKGISGKVYKKSYHKYRKSKCDFCGFIPTNMCQIDIDHIDGNNKNNSPSNFQTLCANCHRLKTFMKKDGIYRK